MQKDELVKQIEDLQERIDVMEKSYIEALKKIDELSLMMYLR